MIRYRCDGCGRELAKDALRYRVKIDIHAAYDEMQVTLMDLVRDHRAELLQLIEQMKHKSVDELESSVYKLFEFDLCPACQRAFIANPLRFHPEQVPDSAAVDIDDFLRSLGYGGNADAQNGE